MRYYKIVLTSPSGGSSSGSSTTVTASKTLTFTTHPNGVTSAPDLGALHVLMDMPITTFDQPNGSAYIEIRGIDIHTISQASNLQGYNIKIYGGMGSGYQLSKPSQSGLLLVGSVYQAFGNWVGTNMSLNLLVQPFNETVTETDPPKFVWHWEKGQAIQDAINKCITSALPGYECKFAISNNSLATHDDLGFYSDFNSIASVILNASRSVNKSTDYYGIQFFVSGQTFYFFDNSSSASPKKIEFTDLIGQPTWLGPVELPKIMLQTVMRADLAMNDVITMPLFNQQGSQTLSGFGSIAPTAQSIQTPKDRSLFQGNFQITGLRHIGDSRNPDGTSWVTVIEAIKTKVN